MTSAYAFNNSGGGGGGEGGGGGGGLMTHTHDRGSSIYDSTSQRMSLARPAGATPSFATTLYSPKVQGLGLGLGGGWDQQQAESYGVCVCM